MKNRHSYCIRPHKKKDKVYIFILVSVGGERKEFSTGISCPASAYIKDARCIVSVPGYSANMDNLRLQECVVRIDRLFYELDMLGTYSLSDFADRFVQREPEACHSALVVLDKFINEQSLVRSWSDATLKKFNVLKHRIHEYNAGVSMNSINDSWLIDFMSYLSKGYTRTLKDGTTKQYFYRNASLAKMLKNFRWFLRWAKKKGYYNGNSENFTMDFKGGSECLDDIVFLTSEELHALMDHHWGNGQQHLERVVDVFVFSCFCGLRYSDIASLRRFHIHDGQIFTTIDKTEVKVAIPLNKVTTAILDKYKDYSDKDGHPFPVISNQRSNEYIKEAARICGIDSVVNEVYYVGNQRIEKPQKKCDVLSFHCARRTFITQALVLGIPDSVLIQFTGHTSTKMLKRYQGVVDDLKQKSMKKFDNL